MDDNTPTTDAEVSINMYPSVKEQVVATTLVSLVSIAIPLAAIAIVGTAGAVVDKSRTWNAARKARKEAKTALFLPTETE